MKSPSIQVNNDEYNKDKKLSPNVTSPALELTNIQDGNIGLHLQVPRGGTHPNGVGSELTGFLLSFLLQLFSFTVDGDPQTFFSTLLSLCTHHIVAQGVVARVALKDVHPHVIICLSVCCVAIQNPLTGYEPNQLDNFDYSEASAAIFQDESVDIDTEPSYSCDAEFDDEIIGKALSSTLFVQEREEPANLRQTYHSHEESLLPAQFFFTHTSTGRPIYEPSSDLSQKRKSSRDLENERIRILLERQEDQILAEVRSETQKHELQAESDKRSIQELTGIIDSQRMEIDHTVTGCEQSRRDEILLQEELSE